MGEVQEPSPLGTEQHHVVLSGCLRPIQVLVEPWGSSQQHLAEPIYCQG